MSETIFCIIISVVFPSKVPSVACQRCEWLGELSAQTDQLDLILSDSSWLTAHFTPLCSRLLSKSGLEAWSKLKERQNGANQFQHHWCSAKIQSDYPACSPITDSFLLSCKLSPPVIQVQWQTRHMSLLGQSSAMSKFRSPFFFFKLMLPFSPPPPLTPYLPISAAVKGSWHVMKSPRQLLIIAKGVKAPREGNQLVGGAICSGANSTIHWPFQTVLLTILSSQASPDCNEVNTSSWSFSCLFVFFAFLFTHEGKVIGYGTVLKMQLTPV